MKNSTIKKQKNALANIWDIDIKDPKDGINLLKAICKLDLNTENNHYQIYERKRRNALNDIWDLQNFL